MKKSVIVIVIILVLLGIGVGSSIFVGNIKEDTKNNKDIMNGIRDWYSKLEENIKNYNQIRTSFTDSFQNIYMDNLASDYSKIVGLLLELEENIESDKRIIDKIDNFCGDRLFSENEVNTICSSYSQYYEKLVNVYWNDILRFNSIIVNYNDSHEEKLEEYVSLQVTDYIDYDKDGKYLEKSEES